MAKAPELGQLINLRVDEDLLRSIDEWRRVQADIPTRSEAIRRLIRQAIAKP